jgi:hypothetical protein
LSDRDKSKKDWSVNVKLRKKENAKRPKRKQNVKG